MVGGILGVAAGDGEHGGGRMDLETWGTWGVGGWIRMWVVFISREFPDGK